MLRPAFRPALLAALRILRFAFLALRTGLRFDVGMDCLKLISFNKY